MITSQDTTRQYDGPFAEGQQIYFDISLVELGDIRVTADSDPLELDSDFSVTAIKSEGLIIGATITLLHEVPATLITVERFTPATQEQDYPENGPFEALDIERALDKLTMLAQESRTVLGRYIQINDGEKSSFINALPKADTTRRVVVVTNERATLSDFDAQELYDAAKAIESTDVKHLLEMITSINARLDGLSFKSMTQEEYNALPIKDIRTIYFITG